MNISSKTAIGSRRQAARGFTLIEMIGVLAVIAILAALLVPKVFSAISDARVNNAAVSCETVKTAIVDHYGKYGSLLVDGTATPPATLTAAQQAHYDLLLLKESLLDKPFVVKIGDGSTNTLVEAVDISTGGSHALTTGGTVDGAEFSGYSLDGSGKNSVVGSVLVQAVITGVTEADAQALSQRVDGISTGMSTALGTSDTGGRIKYTTPASGGTTTVYVYLTHR